MGNSWWLNLLNSLVAIAVLILAIMLDLVLGDPSPNFPDRWIFKLHPTVLMGKFTKKIEPFFKNPNPKIEKLLGVFLALTVICAFTLPVYFGLWAIYTYISIFVYAFIGIILVKMTICIKLETDWAKAAAKAIQANEVEEAKKYSHFSRRDSTNLNGSQMSSAVIESMAENLIDFKLSPMLSFALFGVTGAIAFRAINTLDGMVGFKDKEHINTGWFSANLDTVVNYIPTRLTALFMIVCCRYPWQRRKKRLENRPQRPQENAKPKPWLANGGYGWCIAGSAGEAWTIHSWGQFGAADWGQDFGCFADKRCHDCFVGIDVCRRHCRCAVVLFAVLVQSFNRSIMVFLV